ncbi:hypothetical protein ZWY2020_031424 [Hordeum vulgare]|nr:hypothetical protein ZWY2020_031424 [Hordeum vulgare]
MTARLPEDVLADVLRRVALQRSLAVSRCVCKAWRAVIDGAGLVRGQLPFIGIFICFRRLSLPEFFSRPASRDLDQPAIGGKLDFLPRADGPRLDCHYYIEDHCNGLLLLQGNRIDDHYVVNPATRWRNALPLCPPNHTKPEGIVLNHDYYLAFDPKVSSHYQVFQIPYLHWGEGAIDPSEETSEWPPSPYILHVFSSRTSCWEERLFVRQGDAAGTLAKVRVHSEGQLHSVCWRGSLYVHCQSDFIMRISLSEDKYSVIKPPMDIGWSSFMGLSEKAASEQENVSGGALVGGLEEILTDGGHRRRGWKEQGDLVARLQRDVRADVLRRVGAQQRWLAVSRCVCKAWRAVIDGERLLRTELPFSGLFLSFTWLPLPFRRCASLWAAKVDSALSVGEDRYTCIAKLTSL